MRCVLFFSALVGFLLLSPAKATVIHVPADYPTIQAGINASVNGDTVLVAPGTYTENIQFWGKAIVLTSESGPQFTSIVRSIDGLPVVRIMNGESRNTVLNGFSICGTQQFAPSGKGIYIYNASPSITNNRIHSNNSDYGGGIYCNIGAPLISGNYIYENSAGAWGAGIYLLSSVGFEISQNYLLHHSAGVATVFVDQSTGLIDRNVFVYNSNFMPIEIYNSNNCIIRQNTLSNNSNPVYGQIGVNSCQNTNINSNIIVSSGGFGLFFFGEYTSSITYNDVWDNGLGNYFGAEPGIGSISLNPLFNLSDSLDFNLTGSSPCIDAGDPAFPLDPDGSRADIGALYYDHTPGRSLWHVSTTGDDTTGDGSPENPFRTIQKGIDMASHGDTVLVSDGLYQENINFLGKNILVCSEYIYTGDTLDVDSTIIDGGAAGTVVTFDSGEDSTCVLEGFTITNGYFYRGGGVKCINGSSPFITHNVITGNRAYNDYYAVRGGGIYCDNSNSRIVSNIIRSNTASHSDASSSGGGLYFVNGNVMIQGNRISGNSAISTGAGMSIISSNGTITGNIIEDNLSYLRAGGMYCQGCTLGIYQNLIVGNNTYAEGGGIYLNSSECDLQNNTIVGNIANYGSAVYTFFEPFTIENTIIWGNTGDLFGAASVVTLNYCDAQDSVYPGNGNISADPLLTDEYHLLSPSPCIDAGDPASEFDPDGTRTDMGAYYYHQTQLNPFNLISPGQQAVLTNTLPTLEWSSTSHQDTNVIIFYRAYWDDNGSFATPDSSVDLPDTAYAIADSLSRSTSYYWKVRAFGIHAFPRESDETRSFYIDGFPTEPTIIEPVNGSPANSATYLIWLASTDPDTFDAVSYSIQIDDDSAFASPEINQSGMSSRSLLLDDAFAIMLGELEGYANLQADTSYFWRVRADDNYGLSSDWTDGTNWFTFLPQNHAPAPPDSGFSPANGEEVISLTPVITWNDADDPDPDDNGDNLSYAIRLSEDSLFGGFVYYDTTAPGINQITPSYELDDNTHYFYEVKTIDDGGLSSEWSARQNFWTNHYNFPPEPFPIYGPESGARQVVFNTHFIWGGTVDYDPNASFTYSFQWCADSLFAGFVRTIPGLPDTVLTIPTDTLSLLGQNIFWRILAIDDDSLIQTGGIAEHFRALDILPPGDANSNGVTNGVDVTYLVNYLKGLGPAPDPILAGDANGNCQTNGVDVTYLVNYLKGFGSPPLRPNCLPGM